MNDYFRNSLNEGEFIEIEIKHSAIIIVETILITVLLLGIATALHFGVNTLIENLDDGTEGYKIFSLLINIAIWFLIAVLGVFYQIKQLIAVLTAKLALTNRRLIGKAGIFSINAFDLPIEKIASVAISVPFLGRILNYSSIVISSTNGDGATFKGITNANDFRNKLTEAIAKNQDEARKAQATEIASAINNQND